MGLTDAQWVALAVIPHISGFLSLVGSLAIIQDVLRDRKKRQKVYSRLMLGISFLDVFTSIAYFMSTWAIPVESAGPAKFAKGTQGTCTAQGFFVQASIAGPFYNVALAIYYLLVLRRRWSEIDIKKIEKYFHAIPLTIGFGTAIAGLFLKLYNNSNLWCWISGLPGSCAATRDSDGECIRGDNAWIYRWAFFYALLWGTILTVTFIMGGIVQHVMREEKQSRRWRRSAPGKKDATAKLSQQVFWQSIHYVCSFYLTYTFPTILRLLQTIGKPVPYPIFVLMAFFIPMQGFFNATVYFSPRIRRSRGQKEARGGSTWGIRKSIRDSVNKFSGRGTSAIESQWGNNGSQWGNGTNKSINLDESKSVNLDSNEQSSSYFEVTHRNSVSAEFVGGANNSANFSLSVSKIVEDAMPEPIPNQMTDMSEREATVTTSAAVKNEELEKIKEGATASASKKRNTGDDDGSVTGIVLEDEESMSEEMKLGLLAAEAARQEAEEGYVRILAEEVERIKQRIAADGATKQEIGENNEKLAAAVLAHAAAVLAAEKQRLVVRTPSGTIKSINVNPPPPAPRPPQQDKKEAAEKKVELKCTTNGGGGGGDDETLYSAEKPTARPTIPITRKEPNNLRMVSMTGEVSDEEVTSEYEA